MNNTIFKTGTRLKRRYEILGVLGSGGFATTYKAVDILIGRYVAIKVSSNNLSKEAKILKHLNNVPYISHMYDYFHENNSDCIVMQLIKGKTLSSIDKTPDNRIDMPYNDLVMCFSSVCMSLYQMHSAGIIHRDISPGNLILTEDNSLYLIDFGTATSITNDSLRNVLSFSHKGLDAPERADEKLLGPGTDIYSLCATLVYLLCGEGILPAEKRKEYDALPSILSRLPFSRSKQNAIIKGLNLDISKRYGSMAEFMNDFYGPDNDISNSATNYEVSYYAKTDIGSRHTNQDNFMLDSFFSYAGEDCVISGSFPSKHDHLHIVAIADGVGGSSYSEFASKAAIQAVSHFIDSYKYSDELPETLLREMLTQINEKIISLSAKIGKTASTLSVLMWKDNSFYIANIGDSPIYMLSGSKLSLLTTPHTLSRLKLSKNEPINISDYHTLTRYLGKKSMAGCDMASFYTGHLSYGDAFLICTDGVSNKFTEGDIKKILKKKMDKRIPLLWKKRNKDSNEDNSTAICLQFDKPNS